MAWNAHVDSLPPPDPMESAKRSKYVKDEVGSSIAPLAPANPVRIEMFLRTKKNLLRHVHACGNLFPAQRIKKK